MNKIELQKELAKFLQENGTELTAMLISDSIDQKCREGESIDYMHRAIAQHLLDINKVGSLLCPSKKNTITTKVTK